MPKDEFDFDDPLELNGVSLACGEDTTAAMTECFVEEFMRLGYNHKQILALFRNPQYLGMKLVLEQRGEQFVRDAIAEVFARRGKMVPASFRSDENHVAQTSKSAVSPISKSAETGCTGTQAGLETCATKLTDPLGAPLPDLTI